MMVWCRPCPWLTVCGWEHVERIKNDGDGWMSGQNVTKPMMRALADTMWEKKQKRVPETCCYLWARCLCVLASVSRHITRSHTLTPLACVNINTEIHSRVSRGFYCLENAQQSSIHLPSERHGANNITTLSALECWCMHGHTERQSVGKEGHSAGVNIRVAERTDKSYNAGHLSSREKREYTHTAEGM